jgi:anti-sigma regulatory factor (Ser/Thr protein kinase)
MLSAAFTAVQVAGMRHEVRRYAADAGLTGDHLDDFVLAVHELVANAIRHGGGSGHLRVRRRDDTLTCEVRDDGGHRGVLRPHLPTCDVPGGRGLWLAQQLTAGLMLTAGPHGVSATITVCLTPASQMTAPGAGGPVADPAGADAGTTASEGGTS